MLIRILVFVWFPLSVGIFDHLDVSVRGAVTVQHLLLWGIFAVGVGVRMMRQQLWSMSHYFLVFFLYVAVSGVVLNFGGPLIFRLVALFCTYQWAAFIADSIAFEDFLHTVSLSAICFLLFSFAYVYIDRTDSFKLMQGQQVLNSFFVQKNSYGRFLQIAFLLFLAELLFFRRLYYGVFLLLALLGLNLSDSKTSMAVALVSSVALAAIVLLPRLARYVPAGIGGLLMAGGVLWWSGYISFFDVGSRFDGVSIAGVKIFLTGRATIWAAVLNSMASAWDWLFGFGLGQFFDVQAKHVLAGIGLGKFLPEDPHNGYVGLLVDFGLVGMIVFAYVVLGYARLLWRESGSGSSRLSAFAAVLMLCLFLANLTESYFVRVTNIYMALFWIVLAYLEKSPSRDSEEASHARVV